MKKMLIVALLTCFSVALSAQSNDYITFRTTDGTEYSLGVDKLKITFKDGKLLAADAEKDIALPLADMAVMFFSATPTAIETAQTAALQASIRGGNLSVDAPQGTIVSLYAADGRLLGTYVKGAASAEILESGIAGGAYLVKVGEQTLKLLAR